MPPESVARIYVDVTMKPIILTLLAVTGAFRQDLTAEDLTCPSAAERETAESRPAAANIDS